MTPGCVVMPGCEVAGARPYTHILVTTPYLFLGERKREDLYNDGEQDNGETIRIWDVQPCQTIIEELQSAQELPSEYQLKLSALRVCSHARDTEGCIASV